MPNLLELKSLDNLKYVHRQYLRFIDKHRKPKYWKHMPCPICKTYYSSQGANSATNLTIDGLYYFTCPKCNSVYNAIQLMVPMDKLYGTYRDRLVKPSAEYRWKLGVEKCRQIEEYCNGKGRMLDVGCGSGQMCQVFRNNGWKALGVDPCINVAYEEFYTNQQFDCITFLGVLEHINNPMELLRKAIGMIQDNGLIVIEVPSADCLLMQYLKDNPFSPYRFIEHCRHLSFWSKHTIGYICGILGLEVIEWRTIGFDLQTIFLTDDKKLVATQDSVDRMLLGDHYRLFIKRRYNGNCDNSSPSHKYSVSS